MLPWFERDFFTTYFQHNPPAAPDTKTSSQTHQTLKKRSTNGKAMFRHQAKPYTIGSMYGTLLTFTIKINQLQVNIPYMDPMGTEDLSGYL